MADPAEHDPGRAHRPGRAPASPGIPLGRVFGVPVFLAPSWFLVAAVITVLYAPAVRLQVDDLGALAYVVSGAFAVLLALSVLLHELGHVVVSLALHLKVRRITVFLLGGVSEIETEPQTPGREYLVAIAGPLVSLLLAGVALAGAAALPQDSVASVLAFQVALANGFVAAFNLLPGLPLDGGRVLRAAVWWRSGDKLTGTRAAAGAGKGLAALVLLGAVLLPGRGVDAAANVVFAALVATFIWFGAGTALRAGTVAARLPTLTVGRLVRSAVTVSADTPLAEAMRRAHEGRAGAVVVVDGDGRPDGIVDEEKVRATPQPRRPWVSAGSLAQRVTAEGTLTLDTLGPELLERLREHPLAQYLVVDTAGAPVGVLVSDDVVAAVDPDASRQRRRRGRARSGEQAAAGPVG